MQEGVSSKVNRSIDVNLIAIMCNEDYELFGFISDD